MTTGELIRLNVIDILLIVGISVLVGASAPRWPSRWLGRDVFPLAFLPWESPAYYRRLGVGRLQRRLPELGAAFGGESKSALPGTSPAHVDGYLRELRRAEWVHWISIASVLVLFAFNPWWLGVAFAVAVMGGNAPFIGILRNNRLRIRRITDRNRSRP